VYLRARLPQEELVPEGATRWLLTCLIMDVLLITGAVIGAPVLAWPISSETEVVLRPLSLLVLGMWVSAAGRCGLAPANGWLRWLRTMDGRPGIAFWGLAILAPAAMLFARGGEFLAFNPQLRTPLAGLLALTGMMAILSAAAQPTLEALPAYAAVIVGACIGIVSSVSGGVIGSVFAGLAIGGWIVLVASGRLTNLLGERVQVVTSEAPSQLKRLAARDWGIAELWWSLIALPLRGAAQVARFVDAFVFDEAVRRILWRGLRRIGSFGSDEDGDPEWLPAMVLVVAAGVLVVMTWR
jgi:hypothetical protein